MKAARLEYRFRYAIHLTIFVLGFFAPWNYWLHLDPPGPNSHVWGILAVNLTQLGVTSIGVAFNLLLSAAIVLAFAAAFLRTWGAAYLGAAVVKDGGMHTAAAASGVIEAGPFRYVRNPLYLGTFLLALALALLMPRSGAIFTIAVIALLQIRLILAEEPFLEAAIGAPYVAYRTLVPRILPSLRPRIAAQALAAKWPQAFLGEIAMWGIAASFAILGWRYDAQLLIQCVIVSIGVAILVRAAAGTQKR